MRRSVFCVGSFRVNRSLGNGALVVDCRLNKGCTPLANDKVEANKLKEIRQNILVSLDIVDLAF